MEKDSRAFQMGTPYAERNPFDDDRITSAAASMRTGPSNPFISPSISRPVSRPVSSYNSSAIGQAAIDRGQRYFHSRRVKKGEVEKPWLSKKDPKEKWVTILPILGIFIGLGVSGVLIWDGLRSVVTHKYCPVLQEDWSGGLNKNVWTQEVQVGGFG